MGYLVFSLDLYGKGVTPKDHKDAANRLKVNGADRSALRARTLAGFQAFEKQANLNTKQIAAVGYGWGGTAALEMARAGADVESVAVVHGDLSTPTPAEAKKGGPWVFAICGSEDPTIPLSMIGQFEDEMRKAGFEWDVFRIGGAAHDFTNPLAGKDPKSGTAYDADSDKRAHQLIKDFLAETFESNPVGTPLSKLPSAKPAPARAPQGVPDKVMTVLKHVDDKGEALPNYEGGRTFLNLEKHLPFTDKDGRKIKYREWDVNPLRQGVNRGVERLITGSDGSAYFTDDHYKTFKKIR
jgi:dienelactone hydrolase/guanyl-specific ribonuclease Sa